MKRADLERMSVDDLWELHVELSKNLAIRMAAEKKLLELRLRQINNRPQAEQQMTAPERRPYPPVYPKFQNPNDPAETWSGRGKQPRWLAQQLNSGRSIDEFRIQMAAE